MFRVKKPLGTNMMEQIKNRDKREKRGKETDRRSDQIVWKLFGLTRKTHERRFTKKRRKE